MPEKLLILLVNTDPTSPHKVAPPVLQAAVAAAMEYAVEVVFAGDMAQLAKQGVADRIRLQGEPPGTLYDLIKDAHEAGVSFKVCPSTLDLRKDELIPEVEDVVGTAYLIGAAMDDNTVTFTY